MEKIFMAGPWITEHDVKIVEDAMRTGWYEHAYDYCEKFQKEFAAYHNRKFGIMTPNCTTAIHLLLTGLDISEGDEVILPECTWIASGAGISYLRATPIFSDIEPHNWCLDPQSVEKQITVRTKAIIMVDLFGNMPLIDELIRVADRAGIPLIEDAAEALGSTYKGTKSGKFGIGSVFSFHRTKTLTTGEGGMLLLDDERLYERCMFLRDHGRDPSGKMYYNSEVTYKYMPFNVQAALGYAQFQRINELISRKKEQLRFYKEHLSDIDDIKLNPEPEGGTNGAWITALLFGKSYNLTKQKAIKELAKLGIPARPFFYPLSSLPAYPDCREKYEALNPVAYDICSRGINLPGAANLTQAQMNKICEGIRAILNGKSNRQLTDGDEVLSTQLSNKILMSYSGKRILLTGGAGYIATKLVELLKDTDCYIIRLDRPGAIFTEISGVAQIKDVIGDVRERTVWESMLEDIDIVFHFAAQTSVKVANQDPAADLENNVMPMFHLLETCRQKAWQPTVLFSGTATEAGVPLQVPVSETHVDNPLTVYALHKLIAENYLKYYVKQGIVKGAVLRLANVYGPGPKSSSPDRGILNLMISNALVGKTLTVYGSGDCLRDYVYVEDVARAFLACAVDIEQVNGQHFVIGCGEGYSIAEAITLVSDRAALKTGKRAGVVHVDSPFQLPIETRNFVADSSRFMRSTGWKPFYSLCEGIDRTLEASR